MVELNPYSMPSSPDIESNAEEKEQIKNHLIDS
jgi:hypothetical protein